jgi:hypothetical protein
VFVKRESSRLESRLLCYVDESSLLQVLRLNFLIIDSAGSAQTSKLSTYYRKQG